MKKLFGLVALLSLLCGNLFAAAIPEVKAHVNDCAGVMKAEQISALETKLTDHERQTSNQIAVVTIKTLDGGSLEDTSIKICEKWKGGLKGKDNGTLLLVVINDHKMRIEVGRGLEGSLPDITCGHIIDEMKPFFRNNDFSGGINCGVDGIISAIKGEYKGTGKAIGETKNPAAGSKNSDNMSNLVILGIALIIVSIFGALLCQIPGIGRILAGGVDGTAMYFLGAWLLSMGWGIFAAIIGAIVGIFAPEILEGIVNADWSSGGGGGSWSSGSSSSGSSGDGGGWGGGGGSFSGGGASGGW